MPAAEPPRKEDEGEDFLLLNPCDGWHLARAIFSKDGEFYGFHNLSLEREFTKDFYIAWAKLPDAVEKLHPIFLQPEQERN